MFRYVSSVIVLLTLFLTLALASLSVPSQEPISVSDNEPAIGETMSLTLYRNPETKASVLDFFTRVAKDPQVAHSILTACDENNVSPILAFALVQKESHFKPHAVGYNIGSRDVGLFQLNSNVYPFLSFQDATDPLINSRLGVRHLKKSVMMGQDIATGLAIYNAGIIRVKANRIPPTTRNYVSEILSRIEMLENDFFQNIVASALASNSSKIGKRFHSFAGSL